MRSLEDEVVCKQTDHDREVRSMDHEIEQFNEKDEEIWLSK